jgi:4-hydroxy-3-polyprenylbenzoate decarboxylase
MAGQAGGSERPLVVALTGASGSVYALRLLDVLARTGRTVHLTFSDSALEVLRQEMGLRVSVENPDLAVFGAFSPGKLVVHHHADFSAGIASGSFLSAGMVIVPCSMSTLGSIAHGITTNLITRAADVHLKERRKLVLVPRETPLNLIHLENMTAVTRAGGIVLPAMPGWYHRPRTLEDLVDFVVARICDALEVPHELGRRWGVPE